MVKPLDCWACSGSIKAGAREDLCETHLAVPRGVRLGVAADSALPIADELPSLTILRAVQAMIGALGSQNLSRADARRAVAYFIETFKDAPKE